MAATTCKYCGEEIVWMETKKGKKIPVDLETCDENDTLYDKSYMKCHFETCTKQPPRAEGGPAGPGGMAAFDLAVIIEKLEAIQKTQAEIIAKLDKVPF